MLTCVFHPVNPFRVVEEDEAERLIETGVWFDCPAKAKAYRDRVMEDVKNEMKAKPKAALKDKQKEQSNEK